MTLPMSLRDFHTLLTVAEVLHFGNAADRLGMAQPQLSEVIRRLEHVYKVKLFTRRPRVRLTPGGEIIVAMARRILNEVEREVEHAQAVAEGKMGMVRLGFTPAVMLTSLPKALHAFTQAHPEVQLDLIEDNSAPLWRALERRELDLIIGRELRSDINATSTQVVKDRLLVVLPEGHRLAKEKVISLPTLRDETFVFFKRSAAPTYYDHIMQACHDSGLYPRVGSEVSSPSVIYALVRAGFGISFGSSAIVEFGITGLAVRPIAEPMADAVSWLSYFPELLSPAAERLRQALLPGDAATVA